MDHLGLTMSVALGKNGIRPYIFLNSFDFADDDIQGFIPGDPDIFALTPVFGISFAVGVPVYSL